MFLSKVTLQMRHSATYRLLADLYAQHRFVLSAFPDRSETADEVSEAPSALYRVETSDQGKTPYLLVQSEAEPNWERVSALHPGMFCSAVVREMEPEFKVGRRLRFRLRANPTKMLTNRDGAGERHPKRVGLYREQEQREWLARTAERSGFQVDPAAVLMTPRGQLTGAKPAAVGRSVGARVRCFVVDYDGILTVSDAEMFERCLREGIGRSKAWGCGLLSVARA